MYLTRFYKHDIARFQFKRLLRGSVQSGTVIDDYDFSKIMRMQRKSGLAALYSTGATGTINNTGTLTLGKNSTGIYMKDGTGVNNSGEIVSTQEGAKG